MNERIRTREVRLIDETGKQVGLLAPFEALKLARERGLDLVEISPTAVPPVCKIMDYGKYLYELSKKLHEQRKHQKATHLKEVKLRPATDEHDYQFKKNHVIRFLSDGDKVKAAIFFRGREMAHQEIGRRKLERLLADVADYGTPEMKPFMEGRMLVTILAPRPGARAATGGRPLAAAKAAPATEETPPA